MVGHLPAPSTACPVTGGYLRISTLLSGDQPSALTFPVSSTDRQTFLRLGFVMLPGTPALLDGLWADVTDDRSVGLFAGSAEAPRQTPLAAARFDVPHPDEWIRPLRRHGVLMVLLTPHPFVEYPSIGEAWSDGIVGVVPLMVYLASDGVSM